MKVWYFIIGFVLIFISCHKQDIQPGIIVENVDLGICFQTMPKEEYVISSDTNYQLLQKEVSCQTEILPFIDFTKYTLLGKYSNGNCKAIFKQEVTKDDLNLKYIYNVYVFEKKRNCKVLTVSMNWVLVPKLPAGYSVEFNIKNE